MRRSPISKSSRPQIAGAYQSMGLGRSGESADRETALRDRVPAAGRAAEKAL